MIRRSSVLRAVGLVALLVGVATGSVPLSEEGLRPHLSAYASGPDNLESFRDDVLDEGFEWGALVTGPAGLREATDPSRTVYVVVGTEVPYTRGDLEAIHAFAEAGGHLFVADNGPGANGLLTGFGLAVANRTLLDPATPESSWVSSTALWNGVRYELAHRSPSVLVPAPDADLTVVAESAATSFLDIDQDGQATDSDLPGPFPTIAFVGSPETPQHAVAADVGWLLSAQPANTETDNPAFRAALIHALLPDGGLVLVDEARHPLPAREAAAYDVVRATSATSEAAWIPWSLLSLLAAGLIWAASRRPSDPWRRHEAVVAVRPWSGPRVETAAVARSVALTILARSTGVDADTLAETPAARLREMARDDELLRAGLAGDARLPILERLVQRLQHE